MSQICEPHSVQEIEEKLSREFRNVRLLNNVGRLSILLKREQALLKGLDNDLFLAYVTEGKTNSSKKAIKVIERVRKNVFKHSKKNAIRLHEIENPDVLASHHIASHLRQMMDLPPLQGKAKADVIKGIAGMLKEYSDSEENPVNAVKQARET